MTATRTRELREPKPQGRRRPLAYSTNTMAQEIRLPTAAPTMNGMFDT